MTATTAPRPQVHREQLARLREVMTAPSGRVVLVNVPMGNFLMVDGIGPAGEEELASAVRALTDLSAAIRLYLQEGCDDLLDPMPVEILWSPPEDDAWHEALPGEWTWTAMVAQPAAVTPQLVVAVRDSQVLRGEQLEPAVRRAMSRVRLGSLREGICAQTAYAGHAERSQSVLERLLDHVRAMGYEPHGPHHEIYVADLRHADAAPLRTVVRQPIRRSAWSEQGLPH
jgi:hypothetical protein